MSNLWMSHDILKNLSAGLELMIGNGDREFMLCCLIQNGTLFPKGRYMAVREIGMEKNIQSIKYSAKYRAIAEIYYCRNQPKYVF